MLTATESPGYNTIYYAIITQVCVFKLHGDAQEKLEVCILKARIDISNKNVCHLLKPIGK